MKVLVPLAVECALWIAFSRSTSNVLPFSGMAITPCSLRNEASISMTLFNKAKQSFFFCCASVMIPTVISLSLRSRTETCMQSSLSCAAFVRGSIFAKHSLTNSVARDWFPCVLMKATVLLSATEASCISTSTCFVAFGDPGASSEVFSEVTSPSAAWAEATLATFSSAAAILLSASSKIFFAATRCSTEENNFFCLASSCCAAPNLVWNLMSSALTSTTESRPFASSCL
mmetsp:Transcript_17780/g.47972  ORF Transcript_17780/g.47972 Transcript_17780/m.47972 type:complete len:230 (+) Transcript_17780:644-1333(+)